MSIHGPKNVYTQEVHLLKPRQSEALFIILYKYKKCRYSP